MAFCSFGGPREDNLCGAIERVKQESSMVPLLSGYFGYELVAQG